MSTPVVTVASGGLPVVEMAAGMFGLPVTEATNGRGIAVTKVVGKPGLPVVFDTIGVAPPFVAATLDPATVTAVTLSGGNLVATNTGTTSADQGARVATAAGKTSGKYYFEITFTTLTNGINSGVGIGTTTSTYTNMGGSATTGVLMYRSCAIYANGSNTSVLGAAGAFSSGQIACIAVDLDNRKIWFCKPGQNWNNNASFNPATNIGGVTIPSGTMVPFCTFGGTSGLTGNVDTANFGASAFVGLVPANFTSGWPA